MLSITALGQPRLRVSARTGQAATACRGPQGRVAVEATQQKLLEWHLHTETPNASHPSSPETQELSPNAKSKLSLCYLCFLLRRPSTVIVACQPLVGFAFSPLCPAWDQGKLPEWRGGASSLAGRARHWKAFFCGQLLLLSW